MRIYSLSNGGLTYYGCTTQPLFQRKAEHKYAYANRRGKYRSSLVFENAENTNTKVEIKLLEEVQGTLNDLHEREKWFIMNHECVNKKPLTLDEKNERRRQRYLERAQAPEIKSQDNL